MVLLASDGTDSPFSGFAYQFHKKIEPDASRYDVYPRQHQQAKNSKQDVTERKRERTQHVGPWGPCIRGREDLQRLGHMASARALHLPLVG